MKPAICSLCGQPATAIAVTAGLARAVCEPHAAAVVRHSAAQVIR